MESIRHHLLIGFLSSCSPKRLISHLKNNSTTIFFKSFVIYSYITSNLHETNTRSSAKVLLPNEISTLKWQVLGISVHLPARAVQYRYTCAVHCASVTREFCRPRKSGRICISWRVLDPIERRKLWGSESLAKGTLSSDMIYIAVHAPSTCRSTSPQIWFLSEFVVYDQINLSTDFSEC